MCVMKKASAFIAVLCCGALYAQPQWHNLYPQYTGLAFGEGKFLAVARDGSMKIMSADGEVLSQRYEAVSGGLRQYSTAAYGAGRFVVMQNIPTLQYSVNGGQNWASDIGSNTCQRLVFGKNRFIGIGAGNNTFVYQPDENNETQAAWTWTAYTSATSAGLFFAASNDEIFVAVGSDIVSSANGAGWAQSYSGYTGDLTLAAYGGGKFVAFGTLGGAVYTSESGSSGWTASASNVPPDMTDVTFGGGKFVAVGKAGKASSSEDGITWTTATLNANDDFIAVRSDGSSFVALGAGGSVYTSPDGVNWNSKADGRTMAYKQIIHGGGKFVAVGDSGVSISTDGKNWIRSAPGPAGLQSVAYGGGRYAAVGDSGAVFVSEDGINWTDHSRAASMMLLSVAYGNDMFVAVGRMTANEGIVSLTLADGSDHWSDESGGQAISWPTATHPISIAFGSGKFIVGGNNAEVVKSTTGGKYWTNITVPNMAGYRFTSITYANDMFIALGTHAGGNNRIFTSPDGAANWTQVTAPAERVRSVTYAKGHYIAVGDTGRIMASPNGQQWVAQRAATNRNLQTICFAEDVLVAGGANGAILYSEESPSMVSIRHAARPRGAASKSFGMSLDKAGRAPMINFLFTPERAGAITVYSLSGKRLYKKNIAAGERSVNLPRRAMAGSGSVIVKYADGGGRNIVQRFQITR